MSIYKTFKLADSLTAFSDVLTKAAEPCGPKAYLDELNRLSAEICFYETTVLKYYAPELISIIYRAINSTSNTIEDAFNSAELSDEEKIDYELMMEDAKERIQTVVLPENSFFFTYINGEYYSVNVDADGNLVEDFKYDQKCEMKQYNTLKDWIDEYKIAFDAIEVSVPIDFMDVDEVCGYSDSYDGCDGYDN
jgi:hypothetical protein